MCKSAVDNPDLSTHKAFCSVKKAELLHRSKKVIHNFNVVMHIIPTIQQFSPAFSPAERKNAKRIPQNCKQVFINARESAKKTGKKKGKADLFFIDKNKKYGIIVGYESAERHCRKLVQTIETGHAPLAQLDRALVYGTKG